MAFAHRLLFAEMYVFDNMMLCEVKSCCLLMLHTYKYVQHHNGEYEPYIHEVYVIYKYLSLLISQCNYPTNRSIIDILEISFTSWRF